MNQEKKGRAIALLPIGVFLVIFIGAGVLFQDFYTMPAIVGFLIALIVAFVQNRRLRFSDKLSIISKGIGEENIVTMCLIFWQQAPFRNHSGSGRCGEYRKSGLVHYALFCCSSRIVCDWLLYFCFHGNLCGNYYSHDTYWCRHRRKNRNCHANLCWRSGLRSYVWG